MAVNEVDFSNYSPLISKGNLNDDIRKSENELMDVFVEKENAEFRNSALHFNDELYRSGKILIDDTVSNYLNVVFNKMYPENKVSKRIKLYAFKSSTINAMCAPNGIIFINLGLLARLKNEVELAFVIAHETAHYFEKHSLKNYKEVISINKFHSIFRKTSIDEQIDRYNKYSQDFEFAADSIAFKKIVSLNYPTQSVLTVLRMLHYDFLPYEEFDFSNEFFNRDFLTVPSCYFLNEVSQLSSIEDYYDGNYTHPNIKRRIDKIESYSYTSFSEGTTLNVLTSDQTFNYVREIARFETIRLDIQRRNYINALFNSAFLLNKYPNNQYLEKNIGKALFGLTQYKLEDKLSQVSKGYTQTEGQIQQLYYLVKYLTKSQLITLSLKYNYHLLKKYPDNKMLEYMVEQLMKNLKSIGIGPENYFNDSKNIPQITNVSLTDSNKDSVYFYQNKSKDFYKSAFIYELSDSSFYNLFKSIALMPPTQKLYGVPLKKQIEEKRTEISKQGVGLKPQSLTIVGLFDFNQDKKAPVNPTRIRDFENKYTSILEKTSVEKNIQFDFLSFEKLKTQSIAEYNRYSLLMEWFRELIELSDMNMSPLCTDILENTIHTEAFSIVGLNMNQNQYSYFCILNDTYTGKLLYSNYLEKLASGNLNSFFIKDLQLITN